MTGFAAACYMRGVPYVQVPTRAARTGRFLGRRKTAINHPLGKNDRRLYQPRRVLSTSTLGHAAAELVAACRGHQVRPDSRCCVFSVDRKHRFDASRDKSALAYAVTRSRRIKAGVVGDERESGRRAILNYGHAFGRTRKWPPGYGTWLHGEAVGCGMVLAAALSARLGLVESTYADRLTRLIARAGLPVVAPRIATDRFIDLMRLDKKSESGAMRFVLLDGPGSAALHSVPAEIAAEVIERNRSG